MKNEYRETKLFFIIACLSLLIGILYYRFWDSDEEKIVKFYEKNIDTYNLLKGEVLRNMHRETFQFQNSSLIDSLKIELHVTHVWISQEEGNNLVIHLETDFENYIDPFEYQYYEGEVLEMSLKDGTAIRQIDNHWGVFRNWAWYWGIFQLTE